MPALPGSPSLLRLYQQAAEQGDLLPIDFYTVKDLLDLSGYTEREPLHALLLAMLLALNEGSLCVEAAEDGLHRRLADLVGVEEAQEWARQILQELREPGFPNLIGESLEESKPVLIHRAGDRDFLYFQKYLKHETLLSNGFRDRLAAGRLVPMAEDLQAILEEVLVTHPLYRVGKPVQLNREQRLAIGLPLLCNLTIISGGPGTGKTSVVCSLVRCLVRCGVAPERIALAAPTGRAAQRLTEAVRAGVQEDAAFLGIGHEFAAHTLHHLLGYWPARGTFRHHAENLLPADVVIMDEVSMVGPGVMAALLQALRPDTRLVLLGDKDQLPSVEAGAFLAHLIPDEDRPNFSADLCARLRTMLPDLHLAPSAASRGLQDVLVVLRENYRSQPEIQEAARAVNAQDTGLADRLPRLIPPGGSANPAALSLIELEQRGGCWLLEPSADSLRGWQDFLASWAEHQFLTARVGEASYQELAARIQVSESPEVSADDAAVLDPLFLLLGRSRILTLLREGFWGSSGVNRLLERLLRPRLDERGARDLFAGAPILITRNDHARGLYNGDIGIALRSRTGGYRVVFQRQPGYLALPADTLPAHELAFALTVHKGQGGEYGQVLLVLPPEGGRGLLTRELIYTGITRAQQLAIIHSSAEMLRQAIGRRIRRESALFPLSFAT